MKDDYKICTRCIMDTTDPDITFDADGVCSNCRQYEKDAALYGYQKGKSGKKLKELVRQIRRDGRGKEYDCILGISGGVDSAYMAYAASRLGLRVLAVHVDAGWNTDIAVENIRKMCDHLKLDLHTVVIDWQAMKKIQRAYMFSGLPNLDVPQDHVFLAAMYQYADKYKVRYMLNGSNLATEGILPSAWGYAAIDFRNIKSVYRKYGDERNVFKKYPHFGILKYIYYQKAIIRVNLLNYIPYSKKAAMETLEKEFGWQYYGGKHFESRFTRFFQACYLPEKFGYDKKRAHLSSLIAGGEMTREEALKEMADTSAYPKEQMMEDLEYILKKLDISQAEWKQIMSAPARSEDDYVNSKKLIQFFVSLKRKMAVRKKS